MELSRNNIEKVRRHTGLGRCRHFFWLGVVFDTVGATLLFTGVFAPLLFYDLLLYLGSIIIFFSLLWWFFWYTGNIEVTPEEESLKRPFDVPSSTMAGALSHRLSLTICNMSTTLTRIRRRCGPGTSLLRPASLSMTVTGRLEDQLGKEDQGKDGTTGAQESGDAQNLCREGLGPKPEAVGSSEGVRSPGPDAGSLGPQTGLPGLVKRSFFTHLEPPEFTPSLPDQAQHPAILSSRSLPVVPPASTRQPLAVRVSSSQSAASLVDSQPAFIVASESQPAVPLSSMTQPTVVLASQSQTAASVASQSQPSVPVASQDHFLVSMASRVHPLVPVPAQSHHQVPLSQLENPPSASQTLSSSAQASQLEALATPVSLIQLLSSQSFQTQSVDLRVSLAVPDFQAFYHSQQTVQSISLVQEIAPSQSAPVQEFQKKPVPQAFETTPRAGQELSQEFPATSSPPPESQAPASQAQQSVSPESTPAPASEKKSRLP
ncbi:transmembrane protein 238 [Ailuropoda melanoleuca]|nr:transmembrane protein 238 [Ailuropoda melanoleuca]